MVGSLLNLKSWIFVALDVVQVLYWTQYFFPMGKVIMYVWWCSHQVNLRYSEASLFSSEHLYTTDLSA